MRRSALGVLAYALWLAGMQRLDAKAVALRLAAEGHRATRGGADGPAFAATEAALESAGVPAQEANALAVALGQRGYLIEVHEKPRRRAMATHPNLDGSSAPSSAERTPGPAQ